MVFKIVYFSPKNIQLKMQYNNQSNRMLLVYTKMNNQLESAGIRGA